MKAIPGADASPQWNSRLIDNLAFIKKNLRYPLTKKTILVFPAFSLLFILFWTFRMIYMTLFIHKTGVPYLAWAVMVFMLAGLAGAIYSYYSVLKFKSIPTPFFANENMKLIIEFLRSQQINVYRHPQAPDVLQILSRPLGNNPDQREVMVFIADDKRILINSHFINQKWSVTPQSRNYRKMASRLKVWLNVHHNESSAITINH